MANKFKKGDHVSWNSEAGHVTGHIIGIKTGIFVLKGKDGTKYVHHATKDDPQYVIKSDISDHIAHHKGSALTKIK